MARVEPTACRAERDSTLLFFGGKRNDLLFGQSGGDWLDGGSQTRSLYMGGKPRRKPPPA